MASAPAGPGPPTAGTNRSQHPSGMPAASRLPPPIASGSYTTVSPAAVGRSWRSARCSRMAEPVLAAGARQIVDGHPVHPRDSRRFPRTRQAGAPACSCLRSAGGRSIHCSSVVGNFRLVVPPCALSVCLPLSLPGLHARLASRPGSASTSWMFCRIPLTRATPFYSPLRSVQALRPLRGYYAELRTPLRGLPSGQVGLLLPGSPECPDRLYGRSPDP